MLPLLDTEGTTLIEALRGLNQRHKDAVLMCDDIAASEMHTLRRDVARRALTYCRDKEISHWDFLKLIEG